MASKTPTHTQHTEDNTERFAHLRALGQGQGGESEALEAATLYCKHQPASDRYLQALRTLVVGKALLQEKAQAVRTSKAEQGSKRLVAQCIAELKDHLGVEGPMDEAHVLDCLAIVQAKLRKVSADNLKGMLGDELQGLCSQVGDVVDRAYQSTHPSWKAVIKDLNAYSDLAETGVARTWVRL